MIKLPSLKLWAIVDITDPKKHRYCYADGKKTGGAMALYDKKPLVPPGWKYAKRVIRVTVRKNHTI